MTGITIRVGDLGRVVTGRTPPAASPEYFGFDYPFITPSDIQEGDRYLATERALSHEGATAFSKIVLPPNAICVVCIASIGKVCMTNRPSVTNQQINSIVVDDTRFYPYYIFSQFRLLGDQLRSRASGVATPIVNKSSFEDIQIDVPPLETQRRIANILSAYDDLIEVNQRRIAILEEMARRLFDEWFVRLRYPGHEDAKWTDGLPAGWQNSKIEDAYEGLFDGPHATPAPSDEGPVFLGIKNIRDSGGLDLSSIRHVSEADFPRWTRRVTPQEGDIVFSYEATLNLYALIPRGLRCCLGRRMALIRPKAAYRYFLFLHMFSNDWRRVIAARVLSGATVDRIPLTTFPQFPLTLPPPKIAAAFSEIVGPQLKMIEVLREQSKKLAQARDILLPRLISGEIDLSAAPALNATARNAA